MTTNTTATEEADTEESLGTSEEEATQALETLVALPDNALQQAPTTEETAPKYTVALIGQWVDESSKKIDTEGKYKSLDDFIGEPKPNSGLLRGLAKTFLGWSDKAPEGNGVLAKEARLYSPYDTIGTVFGSEIPADAKLYAVYFSLNKPPEEPFPQDPFSVVAVSKLADRLKDLVNQNTVQLIVIFQQKKPCLIRIMLLKKKIV